MKKFVLALLAVVLVLGLCTVASAGTACESHDFTSDGSNVTRVAPTCTEDAYYILSCRRADCDATTKVSAALINGGTIAEADKALTHDLTGWIYEDATMCGEQGSKYRDCKRCGVKKLNYTLTDYVDHNWVKDAANCVAVTCLTDGVYAEKCTICGATRSEKVTAAGAHNHAEVIVEVAATCYEDGYKTAKCACGDIKTTYTAAYNHKDAKGKSLLGDVFTTVQPTCYEDGEGYQVCSKCLDKIECPVPTKGHTFTAWHIDEAATCLKDGFKSRDCLKCTDKVSKKPYQEIEVLPALGHKVNLTVTKAATCTSEGTQAGGCERCYTVVTETIPMADHTWTEWTVLGQCKVRTCKVCYAIEKEAAPVAPETPADPDAPAVDEDDNNSEGTGSTTGSGSDASIPATGDNTSNVPYIMMVAAVAGLVVLVASKRKVNC